MNFIKQLIFTITLFIYAISVAQPHSSWTAQPFTNKSFIENKGQFDHRAAALKTPSFATTKNDPEILYGLMLEGLGIYFTKTGIFYRKDTMVEVKIERLFNRESGEKREGHNKEYEKEKRKKYQVLSRWMEMEWKGSNPEVKIIAKEKASDLHLYGNSTRAHGYKKLVYQNIYPNIDVVYSFPENKGGFKYDVVLHPGADPTMLQQIYRGAEHIRKDIAGNILVTTAFGTFTDHAPVAFNDKGTFINCSFQLNKNLVSFDLELPTISEEVIIDPWIRTPTFPDGHDDAYEIDKDSLDNIYVFGRKVDTLRPSIQKYDSAGNLKWTYEPNLVFYNNSNDFGDFAVHPNGLIYFSWPLAGFANGGGGGPLKVNIDDTGGINQVFFFNEGGENWRCTFNCDYTKLYIAQGNEGSTIMTIDVENDIISNVQGDMFVGYIDTAPEPPSNTADIVVDYGREPGEIRAITTGFDGNIYGVGLDEFFFDTEDRTYNTFLGMSDHYTLDSIYRTYLAQYDTGYLYSNNSYNNWGGINGITTDNEFAYTTDGATLLKLDLANGAVVRSSPILNGVADKNAGIAIDECGNIYCGSQIGVVKYDSTLTLIEIDTTPSAVFDLTIGNYGNIYACGDGFVEKIGLSTCAMLSCACLAFDDIEPSCDTTNKGRVEVKTYGSGAPYAFEWNTGNPEDTTAILSGLDPGTYSVKVTAKNGCISNGTITIDSTVGNINIVVSSTARGCDSNNAHLGSVYVRPSNPNNTPSNNLTGTSALPYTYEWSTGAITDSLTGLKAGTYTVTATDTNKCQVSAEVIIPAFLSPADLSFSAENNCFGNNGVILARLDSLSYVSQICERFGADCPFLFIWEDEDLMTDTTIWIPSKNMTPVISSLGDDQTTQIVTIIDPAGCILVDTIQVPITGNNDLVLNLSSNFNDSCALFVAATTNGGSGNYSYSWSNGAMIDSFVVDSVIGVLKVTVVDDDLNCSTTDSVTINHTSWKVDSITTQALFCEEINTGAISVILQANEFFQPSIQWFDDQQNTIASGTTLVENLSEGDYLVSISDAAACKDTLIEVSLLRTYFDLVSNLNDTSICLENTITLTASGAESYEWFQDSIKIGEGASMVVGPLGRGNYIVVGDSQNCKLIDTIRVGICEEDIVLHIPNAFSPNGDQINDQFGVYSTSDIYEMELSVYDRFGKELFITNSLSDRWDGTWNNETVNAGVYVYRFVGRLTNKSEEIRKTGNVTLIR